MLRIEVHLHIYVREITDKDARNVLHIYMTYNYYGGSNLKSIKNFMAYLQNGIGVIKFSHKHKYLKNNSDFWIQIISK
jgi:hypothetical protein